MAQDSVLSDELLHHLMAVGHVDVLVGVPTLNNAATIRPVVKAVHQAFARYFPRDRSVIINSDGVNGFTFDPATPSELAHRMQQVAADPMMAGAMATAGQDLIAEWGPDRFGANLRAAVDHALAAPRRPGLGALALAGLLMFRRERPDD